MGQLGILFTAVLMAGGVLETEAFSFDYVKNFFDDQEDIGNFKKALGDRFNNLDENLRNYINEQNFTDAKATELLNGLQKNDWDKLEPRILTRMSREEMEKLANSGGTKMTQRFLDEFERYMILKMKDDEVTATVRTKMPELNQGEMSALLNRLGSVSSWTTDNITAFGPATLQLPVCLDGTNDKEVLQDVLDLMNNCETTSPPAGCPKRTTIPRLRGPVTMKLLGSPNTWKFSEMKDVIIPEIPFFMIHDVSDSFISDIKSKLIQEEDLTKSENQMEAEAWVAAMCRADGCNDMSASNTKTWFENLSKIRNTVTPSDVSSEAMKDKVLAVRLEENALIKKPIRAMDAAILLDMKLGKENPDTIKQIGGKLAGWAPACSLVKAAQEKQLATVRNELASMLGLVRGPEHMAKVRAAMKTEMEAASSNNVFSIGNVNDYLKAFVSPKLLLDQNSGTLLNLAKKADENYINLTPHQLEVIASKISDTDSQECPNSLCQHLSTSFMATLNTNFLAKIDRNLFGVTLPCLLGAKKMFNDKTTLTAENIEDGEAFLKCMSYKDASKVQADDIFKIFDKIKKKDLSLAACRGLKMKLMEWGEKKFEDTPPSDLLMKLYVNEMYKIPPCVAIMFGPGIYNLNMDKKNAFLNNLCNAENYFSIPKDARRKAVNTLLAETMKGSITSCGLRKIGACAFDLNPSMMRNLDLAATKDYVTLIEESIRQGIADCLDSEQTDEVAEMINRIKGSAKTWKTADDVSCVLDTLSSRGIDRIAADLPPEVFITTGCPMRYNAITAMPKRCMDASERAMMAMKRRKVEKCVKLRETFGTNNKTCDSMMCGNALRMTQSQLERMKKEDVMTYLDELVTEDLDRGKAMVILAKMKETKALKDMSVEELERMKNAWRGLTKRDVADLPAFNPSEHDEVVHQMGMIEDLPNDVMIALKNKFVSEFKAPSKMTSKDVFLYGNLLCFMTKEEIDAIPKDFIKDSMRNLGKFDCKNSATYDLAEAAKAAYNKDVADWDASMVAEMNLLVGGLKPEDLTALPEHAYIGITAQGIQKIDPDSLKVMTVKQANNLDGITAAAVTSAQADLLNPKVRSALNSAKSENLRSGASGLSVPRVIGVVAAVMLFLFL